MARTSFDYIIVGAGSAGSVLANRLSKNPANRVLLIEAGPPDRSIFLHMPGAFAEPLKNDRFNWFYESAPEPFMNNRQMYCPRGRVLGGSSSINGMCYVRGHAFDYDRWASNALPDWSYAHCLPYFRKAETWEKGSDEYRGDSGPLHVSDGPCKNPLYEAFVEAGVQAGYPRTDDMNGHQQEGFGHMQQTTYKGERWSAAKAYMRPALQRENLEVRHSTLTEKILFDGKRAIGVMISRNGRRETVTGGEIILSGGAINSPQLLMLSGIGPASHLAEHDIPVVADLPGVGANLQDHLEIYVQMGCRQPITLYSALSLVGRAKIGLEWLLFRRGPGASNLFESGGFIRSKAGVEHPDLQYHFLPIAISYDGRAAGDRHGFQAHVGPMRPTSRGHVRLKSADPATHPEILFNYMSTEQDRKEMRAAVRLTREIFAQQAFDLYRDGELAPGEDVQSDNEIDAFVRSHGESAYHPSCTCAMGSGEQAVVDGELKVHGLESLRVVDASVMPTIPSGNLNAPTIMIAEKAADIILGNPALPVSGAAVWQHPDWQISQR